MRLNFILAIANRLNQSWSSLWQWRSVVAIFMVAGTLFWAFLIAPYFVEAKECFPKQQEVSRMDCLKPVAQKLRQDSNIATYATATVAAIIASRLSLRASESRSD